MQEAASAINQIGVALYHSQSNSSLQLPCSLIGGIAAFIEPFLDASLREHITPCQFPPDAGAVMLVRDYLATADVNTKLSREAKS